MVHFVGAGPGAPDLITRRGAALLQEADCIIYAGSLVNPALLGLAKPECAVYNSAEMTLEQVLDVMHRVDAPVRYPSLEREEDTVFMRGLKRFRCVVLPGVPWLYLRLFHVKNTWHEEHHRRSQMAARERAGGGDPEGRGRRDARFRHLRRIPDAWPERFRPRAGRGCGHNGDRRHGPFAGGNGI